MKFYKIILVFIILKRKLPMLAHDSVDTLHMTIFANSYELGTTMSQRNTITLFIDHKIQYVEV